MLLDRGYLSSQGDIDCKVDMTPADRYYKHHVAELSMVRVSQLSQSLEAKITRNFNKITSKHFFTVFGLVSMCTCLSKKVYEKFRRGKDR